MMMTTTTIPAVCSTISRKLKKEKREVDVTAQCLKQHTAFYHDITGVGLFSKLTVLRESDLKILIQQ